MSLILRPANILAQNRLEMPLLRPQSIGSGGVTIFPVSLLDLINLDFGYLLPVAGGSNEIAFKLRHQDSRLCAKTRWNSAQLCIMVSIVLYVHHYELVARNIDTFTLRIEKHVVRKFSGGQGSNDFTGVRVKDYESRRLTTDNEKSPMGLV